MNKEKILQSYELAKEKFLEYNVDVEEALKKMEDISLSIHCWQGDDVGGFEKPDSHLEGGGIEVTGNYLGKARNIEELQQDYEMVFSLLPGHHRVNLHAIYGEFNGKFVERDKIQPEHFDIWIEWAKKHNLKIDFNPTFFSHPKASNGYTLSSKDAEIRRFWIEHAKKCRIISNYIGDKLGDACICNIWIPDGSKDYVIDRMGYRLNLKKSLDEIYSEKYSKANIKDSVEGKLFGIGSEAYVVGSNDFYMQYTAQNKDVMLCMDMGHFHPTEDVSDKISSILCFQDELLLHLSRGIRWDSDHVVIQNDDLLNILHEIARIKAFDKVHLALDFFDASINRIGAWVTGARAVLKTTLISLLEPTEYLREIEECGNFFKRLAYLEEMKSMPYGAIWDFYLLKNNVPIGKDWVEAVMKYEEEVLKKRG
ncbi:MAG: L-rhamnose isomerase [Promethearchaeota archaeon]